MDELREALRKRRGELQADMNAIAGALQQIDWTMNEMDEAERREATAADVVEVEPCE